MGNISSTCDLCSRPATQSCNNCRVSLCRNCTSNHASGCSSRHHEIVPFGQDRGRRAYPRCIIHTHRVTEGHCNNCQIPVCMECVTGRHSGHVIETLEDVIATRREIIRIETDEIESILRNEAQQLSDIDQDIQRAKPNFVELGVQARDLRQQWHGEIDGIFDNLEYLIQTFRKYKLGTLNHYRSKIKCRNSNMAHIVQVNRELLGSSNVSEIYNYQPRLTDLRDVPQRPELKEPSLKTTFIQGTERKMEFGKFVNSLTMTSLLSMQDELYLSDLLAEPIVIAVISTQINNRHLCRLTCVGSDRAWVCGQDKTITLVALEGSVRDTVISTCNDFPGDIQLNREGELVYSDVAHQRVNVVRNGNTEPLITTQDDSFPYNLCCTISGDILIGVGHRSANSHPKIVRYRGERRVMEIYKDEHGNPIFQGAHISVTENINGDIITTDANSKAVVALDSTGRVKFRYNQSPPGREMPFCPGKVVTDSVGRIIVADDNHCLHILDQNGRFLRCVDNCGLDRPSGLSLDSEGRLWVGSYHTGEIKVIKYKS